MDGVVYIGHRVPSDLPRMHGVAEWIDTLGEWTPVKLDYHLPGVMGGRLPVHDWGVSGHGGGTDALARAILVDACDDEEAARDSALVADFVEEFVSRWAYGSFTVKRMTIRRWMRGRLDFQDEHEGGQDATLD